MTLLVTAFEPFGPWAHNHTVDIVAGMAERLDGGVSLTLPVDLEAAPRMLRNQIAVTRPSAVLCFGLHGRTTSIRVERAALNVADFRIADNAGRTVRSGPIVSGAPDGLLTSVDVRSVVEALRAEGVAADVSNSAGTYLCNAIYYVALHALREQSVPCLFLHVPPVPGAAAAAAERHRAMRAAGRLPQATASHLTGENGGVQADAAMALDLQVKAAVIAARLLDPSGHGESA
ncbi:MAG: pyroglutamyl-peptidase I [Deltaproteobacteria bacterium]|nr:pyroglutamyl-peptidase I [Deltaproteobacteria bacterium]